MFDIFGDLFKVLKDSPNESETGEYTCFVERTVINKPTGLALPTLVRGGEKHPIRLGYIVVTLEIGGLTLKVPVRNEHQNEFIVGALGKLIWKPAE